MGDAALPAWQEQLREMAHDGALASVFINPDGRWACRVTLPGPIPGRSQSFGYAAGSVEAAVLNVYARWRKETGVPA